MIGLEILLWAHSRLPRPPKPAVQLVHAEWQLTADLDDCNGPNPVSHFYPKQSPNPVTLGPDSLEIA